MRISSLSLLLASFVIHVPWSYALGHIPTVTTTKPSNGTLVQIAGKGLGGQILLSREEWWAVLRAAEDLAGDLGKVVGENLTLAYWDGSTASNVSKTHATRLPQPSPVSGNGNGNGGVVGDAAVPGGNLGHNVTETAASGGITALYTFRAPTSDVNVSQLKPSNSINQEIVFRNISMVECMAFVTGQRKADRDTVHTWASTKLYGPDTATI